MVVALSPQCAARVRVLQWVAAAGFSCSVVLTMRDSISGVTRGVRRSLLHPRFYPPALGQDAQLPLGLRIQFDLVGNSHHSNLLEHSSLHLQISSFNYGAPH